MLHAVRFDDGRASYRNRWVRTRGLELERKRGRALWTGLLERRQFDNPEGAVKNTANAGLVCHAGRLLALHDQGEPYEVELPGLDTAGVFTANRRLRHPLAPHPKVDPATGEMFAIGYSPVAKPHLQYSLFAADGGLVHTTAIELPIGVMVHDFALTERFAVLMNHPYTFDVRRWLRGEPIARFEPERGSFIGLLPRRASGSEVRWFPVAPCFVYHVVNAWDDGEHGRARRVPPLGARPARRPRAAARARGALAALALAHRPARQRRRCARSRSTRRHADLPSIHPAKVGRRARFAFASRLRSRHAPAARRRAAQVRPRHAGQHPRSTPSGRTASAARGSSCRGPGASDEDDGWLLAFVHDEAEGAERAARDRRPRPRGAAAGPGPAPAARSVRLARPRFRPLFGAEFHRASRPRAGGGP